jgi:hypothetical protein
VFTGILYIYATFVTAPTSVGHGLYSCPREARVFFLEYAKDLHIIVLSRRV